VSTFIQPVTPVSTETASVAPTGTITTVSSGESVVVTEATVGPSVIEAPETGVIEVASEAEGADVIIDGPGTAAVAIGTAVDAEGNPLSGSGTSYQVADGYQGSAVVNLDGAITDGADVDTSTAAIGGGTIASNLPGSDSNAFATAANLDFYVNTGAANDQVQGSQGNDFIRLGAGNDQFNAGAGDDIVRVGIGNDSGTLGAGNDIVYLTVDQLQGDNVNTITDFDVNGDDKIQIDADLEDLVDIEGVGTNAIIITLSGAQTGTTAVVSEGESIDDDDIEFV
jgi:Ca2+-binding RTX toxin-like protein